MSISYIQRNEKPSLAYVYSDGAQPLVMFCGGYRSDMNGTKATYLEEKCKERGQAYIRFDYSGHGQSEGEFEDGKIGDWAQDALDIFDMINPDKAVIIGSSMGGWIALLLAQKRAQKLCGLIGIAAAPDFTDDMYARLTEEQREELVKNGFVKIPNDYSDEPYHYSQNFYDESKMHYLLDMPHIAPCPMRLFQGLDDTVVLPEHAYKIKDNYTGDVQVIEVEGGDHSLSRPEDLVRLDEMAARLSNP